MHLYMHGCGMGIRQLMVAIFIFIISFTVISICLLTVIKSNILSLSFSLSLSLSLSLPLSFSPSLSAIIIALLYYHVIVFYHCLLLLFDRLVGLVLKASALGAEDLGFKSRLQWDFSGLSHTSDLKIGTPVATLPGAWHYRVSTGTGRSGVSIL